MDAKTITPGTALLVEEIKILNERIEDLDNIKRELEAQLDLLVKSFIDKTCR